MPELPEVETIRLKLIPLIVSKTVKDVDILTPKQFIGNKQIIIGKKIINIQRTGKVFNIFLNNKKILNIHLKMTGQLLIKKDKTTPDKNTRIIVEFTDNTLLFFNDLRKFGWFKVTSIPEGPKGIDILSNKFTLKFLIDLVNPTNKPIKLLLMDQEKISGLGNIYANDSLFLAKIHPLRIAKSLKKLEIKNLFEAINTIIKQALKNQGSTGADNAYVLPNGQKGNHQKYFQVYQREKLPCLICKIPIKRIKQAGRSSFFCPVCQK